MFSNLVTYHVHRQNQLPPIDALAYQYILAGNGVFIRAETSFFDALFPFAPCTIRGLVPLCQSFRLKVPRVPAKLLDTVLTDALRARRPAGDQAGNELNEVLYQLHHYGRTVQVKKPPQRATGISVTAAGSSDLAVFCDLHSHGNMHAFWSRTDDADEQSARVFAVIGKLDTEPEIRLRIGLYGYWRPLPVTAVFTGSGPFKDLFKETKS